MARIRDINDIDEDEDGQIVDYSGDSGDCRFRPQFLRMMIHR